MTTVKTLASALMITLCSVSLAKAQSRPTPNPAGGATMEKLGQLIDSIGYDSESIRGDDGSIIAYKLIVERDGRQHFVLLETDSKCQRIVATVILAEMKSEHRSEGSRLFKLLELNGKYKCQFTIVGDGRFLALQYACDNSNPTARDLRSQVDLLLLCKQATQNDWDPKGWNGQKPAPAPIQVPFENNR